MPHAGWLQQQQSVVSEFWRLEVLNHGLSKHRSLGEENPILSLSEMEHGNSREKAGQPVPPVGATLKTKVNLPRRAGKTDRVPELTTLESLSKLSWGTTKPLIVSAVSSTVLSLQLKTRHLGGW